MLDFISASPTCFHAIANTAARLTAAGYTPLSEDERWTLHPGDRRFVIRGGSSIIAFRVPQELRGGFMMAAAHSDSPHLQTGRSAPSCGAAATSATHREVRRDADVHLVRPASLRGRHGCSSAETAGWTRSW